MARRSVLAIFLVAATAAGCVSVGPETVTPQPNTATPAFLTPAPLPTPTISPAPTPTQEQLPTAQPTRPAEPSATTLATPPPPATGGTTPPASPEPPGSGEPGGSPPASPIDIGSFLTSTVGLVNLSDSPVSVTLNIYSDGEDQGTIAKKDVAPFSSIFQNVLESTYVASFVQGDAAPLTCTFDAKEGEELDFTVVNGDVLLSKVGATLATADDLFIATSSLCRATGS